MNRNLITVYSETGEIIFNTADPLVQKKKNKKRKIVHQIFEEMRAYNTIPKWDTFLVNASHNVFTKGFTFKTDTLTYSIKSKYVFPQFLR